jgi:hypothetical protein
MHSNYTLYVDAYVLNVHSHFTSFSNQILYMHIQVVYALNTYAYVNIYVVVHFMYVNV